MVRVPSSVTVMARTPWLTVGRSELHLRGTRGNTLDDPVPGDLLDRKDGGTAGGHGIICPSIRDDEGAALANIEHRTLVAPDGYCRWRGARYRENWCRFERRCPNRR